MTEDVMAAAPASDEHAGERACARPRAWWDLGELERSEEAALLIAKSGPLYYYSILLCARALRRALSLAAAQAPAARASLPNRSGVCRRICGISKNLN